MMVVYPVFVVFSSFMIYYSIKKSINARYMATSIVVTMIFVVTIELSLRVIDYPKNPRLNGTYRKLAKIIDIRSSGTDVYPFVSAPVLRDFSKRYKIDYFLSGIGNVMTILGEEDDGMIVYKSDSNGFRNPYGYYMEHETFDTCLLGDSFTHGEQVPDGFTIADFLRSETERSVYNAGVGGSGFIHQLGVFLEFVL